MPKERVHIVHDFALPVERVFAFLAEHENLGTIFAPARIVRLCDGTDGRRNGVGSIRRLELPLVPPLEETVTKVVDDALIEYAITRGGPLTGHLGRMAFEREGTGTRLTYTIVFDGVFPGVATIVGLGLTAGIKRGLRKIDGLA